MLAEDAWNVATKDFAAAAMSRPHHPGQQEQVLGWLWAGLDEQAIRTAQHGSCTGFCSGPIGEKARMPMRFSL